MRDRLAESEGWVVIDALIASNPETGSFELFLTWHSHGVGGLNGCPRWKSGYKLSVSVVASDELVHPWTDQDERVIVVPRQI